MTGSALATHPLRSYSWRCKEAEMVLSEASLINISSDLAQLPGLHRVTMARDMSIGRGQACVGAVRGSLLGEKQPATFLSRKSADANYTGAYDAERTVQMRLLVSVGGLPQWHVRESQMIRSPALHEILISSHPGSEDHASC
ncbi:hypothetical protein KL905_004617 [Ogataea polymorpha]|nr:hypothetical protein KL907_004543 [Ogataea polymorpha]KAG7914496.1 hypothetical protein KL927_004690 [Ogataea polymorpha]KAG7916887.1 hypothetical protein KL905_004617 [Ogataea polymorpha]